MKSPMFTLFHCTILSDLGLDNIVQYFYFRSVFDVLLQMPERHDTLSLEIKVQVRFRRPVRN